MMCLAFVWCADPKTVKDPKTKEYEKMLKDNKLSIDIVETDKFCPINLNNDNNYYCGYYGGFE